MAHLFNLHQNLPHFAKFQQHICGAFIRITARLVNLRKIATTYLWRIHSLNTKICQPSQNCNNIFVAHPFASQQDLSTFAKLQQHICGASIRLTPKLANLRKIAITYLWRIHSVLTKTGHTSKIATTYLWCINSLYTKTYQPSRNCNSIFVTHPFVLQQNLFLLAKL